MKMEGYQKKGDARGAFCKLLKRKVDARQYFGPAVRKKVTTMDPSPQFGTDLQLLKELEGPRSPSKLWVIGGAWFAGHQEIVPT